MLDKPYEVISMSDTDRIGDGGTILKLTDVLFKVGKLGPFRVQVEKNGNWEQAMQSAIDAEVRRVKSIAG